MKPLILDNILPESYVNELEHTLTMVEFDWHLRPSISYGGGPVVSEFEKNDHNIRESRGFSHRFFYEKQKSQYCDFVRPIMYFIESKTDIKINSIERMRAVYAPSEYQNREFYNVPHVDMGIPHLTLIYYVNDCDSGTILFKEKYDPNNNGVDTRAKTFEQYVEAKRGRILIFDGLTYHTGKIPGEIDKILININFT